MRGKVPNVETQAWVLTGPMCSNILFSTLPCSQFKSNLQKKYYILKLKSGFFEKIILKGQVLLNMTILSNK